MSTTITKPEELYLALGAEDEEGLLEVLSVTASEVQIDDLLMGFWVTGITKGRHDGSPAYTFQLGSPMTPNGELTRGRMTLIDSKDEPIVVVREKRS